MAQNELREADLPPDDRSLTGDTGADTSPRLSKDDIFTLLKNSRRRTVVRWLVESDGPGTTGELAEHIAAQENDVPIQSLTSQQRKRVYISLYQCHLPKMDDHGVIDFDRSRGTVELTGAAENLFPYLELVQSENDRSRSRGRIGSVIRQTLGHLP